MTPKMMDVVFFSRFCRSHIPGNSAGDLFSMGVSGSLNRW